MTSIITRPEADGTFVGEKDGKRKAPGAGGYAHKMAVLGLTERVRILSKTHKRSWQISTVANGENILADMDEITVQSSDTLQKRA